MDEKQQRKKRHRNAGLRKQCGCARSKWSKCAHPWHFNFKVRGGPPYRFSLDKHFNRHIDSKSEAEELAADLRKQIRAGTFGRATPVSEMTLRQLMDVYVEREVRVKRAAYERASRYQLDRIAGTVLSLPANGSLPFGDWRVADIVTDTVEQFRAARYADGTGPTGTNRYLGALRALFKWALLAGYVERTPFKRHGEAAVKLEEEAPRTRRLRDGEAERLLSACGPRLRAIVECALETGMRSGEIVSLQWSQVEGLRLDDATPPTISWAPQAAIFLPKTKTKTKRDRRIPISARFKAILEMRRLDPAGKPLPLDGHVFGNAVGERVGSSSRAWYTAILKAHGHEPTYTAGANLAPSSRAALAAIDLHFHDLRREAGSRWMDNGTPLATIQRWLGHSNISQTSTYLAGTAAGDHEAMRRLDERRAACNELATDGGSPGHERPPAATPRDKNANETAGGRVPTIM